MPSASDKPPVKTLFKKQPYYAWRCSWILGKRKKRPCGMIIKGPGKALVERSSDQHWEKHLRQVK